ncbi:site-specific integrase [Lichenicoccus sp.]|uniref:site-specific integrase n=1 Tax=Lichenicoccus sp. TaxID=2781899 RepID=UPI003D0AF7E2
MATIHVSDPWKDPRTGVLYFRKRIPARFKAVSGLAGDTIKISLKTSDRRAIAQPWAEALTRWAELEAEWTRKLTVVTLTHAQGADIAAKWAACIAGGAPLHRDGENSDVFDLVDLPEERTEENIARMWDRVEYHADEALRLVGVETTPESRSSFVGGMLDVVRCAYLDADLKALGMRGNRAVEPLQAARDALPPVADVPTQQSSTAARVPLLGLFDAWKASAVVKPRTMSDTRYILDALIKHLGHNDAASVSRDDIAQWRDALKACGLSNNTWNNRLSLVRQVFEWGFRESRLPANVADANLRLKKSKTATRLPYTDADTVRILQASRLEARESLRWAPG